MKVFRCYRSQPVRKMLSTILALTMTTAAASATPIGGYKTNWVDPQVMTVTTASKGPVLAEVTETENTFDGDPLKGGAAHLRLFLDHKIVYREDFAGKIVRVTGPSISSPKKGETMVAIEIGTLSDDHTFGYVLDDASHRFRKIETQIVTMAANPAHSETFRSDLKRDLTATLRLAQEFQSWGGEGYRLEIQKAGKTVFSGPIVTDDDKLAPDRCHGPFITSLGGDGQFQIICLSSAIVRDDASSSVWNYGNIFYNEGGKWNCAVSAWGINSPRLAKLSKDGRTQIVTEDWSLSKDLFHFPHSEISDMGGPLQIWQWGKDNRLVDVTKQYPSELRHHADVSLQAFHTEMHGANSLIAYVGDLCRLGQKQKALTEFNKLLGDGYLKPLRSKILAGLKKHGYL